MIALIDGDSLLYKIGFIFQETNNWNELEVELGLDEPLYIVDTDIVSAKNAIDALIDNIMFKTGTDDVEIWLTGYNNFRYQVDPTYKHNRSKAIKPVLYTELWDYICKKYKANIAHGYEADDVVVYKKTIKPNKYVLCAIDKDVLCQTVGTHYNYTKDEMITITKQEAIRFAYYQTLVGDKVDGYPGCPGIGPVKAKQLLDKAEDTTDDIELSYWLETKQAFEAKGLTEEDAIKQMRLANMHQLDDTKIKLWKPPKHLG